MGVRSCDMRIFLGLTFLFSVVGGTSLLTHPSLYPKVISADYGILYQKAINYSIEYVFLYSEIPVAGARITVQSNATVQDPLVIVVRQRSGILSWQIPFVVQSPNSVIPPYDSTSRNLCSTDHDRKNVTDEAYITVSISTGSSSNIAFQMMITEADFNISVGDPRNVTISPAEPIYYSYNFDDENKISSVLMQVESDSEICMTISIQNVTCPIFDLERNVQYSGYWQTVSRRGGITISRDAYPEGFFVVLVVKGDDTDCNGTVGDPNRRKTVHLLIKRSISKEDFITASALALSIGVGFCTIYIFGVVMHRVRKGRELRERLLSDLEESEQPEHLPSPSTVDEVGPSQWTSVEEDSSLDEDDIDMLDDALTDKEIIRTKRVLAVSDLARKEPKILRQKSRLYLYYLITIAVFYTLPVMQLVITYQYVLHETGNQDLCYYNFLCAHPLGVLSDFNHVFSNFGYVLLGFLFIFLTYTREKNDVDRAEKSKSYGIPQHYGLFYAMGTALMMEGLLSGSYHVCPSHSNFQFDTSFMYIISVLCMVKIYQNRHPDINARASVTFAVLALIIFLGMVGVLKGTENFWIFFTMIHLLVCVSVTAQIYYMGRFRLNRGLLHRVIMTFKHDARAGRFDAFRPLYGGRLILLLIANCCNVALAVWGNMHHDKDFATFLLYLLMSNLILYTFFYIVMKLLYGEKILLEPSCYIILSFVTWGGALYFFINKSISWALTPAQSRIYNKPCALLNFFDSHDIWHFLSALAMFFSFMVLLTLDDDLEDTHRSLIPVF
ncbi:SID1 transmembrane family member 1-like isoform X2 [Venturia canescens]|uniref:SID1 transmembrane family member 1-like isoform X2 n=1 Tax=Venturia canescens TaxID=32260 RepID=UPI001C9CCDC8|nr:SID1 transmembrane family member 1-like isoform X2 [Venturia canescens]